MENLSREPGVDEPRTQSDPPEIQSFIIKLWMDGPLDESGQGQWRGRITHVPSGTRRYLKSINDILIFIRSYLDSMSPAQEKPQWIGRGRRLWRRLLKRKS
jgi:hypothetical protein